MVDGEIDMPSEAEMRMQDGEPSAMEELVFVGGPVDGKRLRVRAGDQTYNYLWFGPLPSGTMAPRIDTYHRMQMSVAVDIGEWISETIMRHDALDEFGALRRLLLGYQRKPRATRPPTGNARVTDRRAQFGAMFGMGQRRQEEMSQRPHPHTSSEAGIGITYDMFVSSLQQLQEDYLRGPLEETAEANERAEAAGLNMEGQV